MDEGLLGLLVVQHLNCCWLSVSSNTFFQSGMKIIVCHDSASAGAFCITWFTNNVDTELWITVSWLKLMNCIFLYSIELSCFCQYRINKHVKAFEIRITTKLCRSTSAFDNKQHVINHGVCHSAKYQFVKASYSIMISFSFPLISQLKWH